MAENNIKNNIPLCVDLDGTLIASDTLLESMMSALKAKPIIFFLMPFWILMGKSFFKNKIKEISLPNPKTLPYRKDFIDYLKSEKDKGRDIVLATATVQEIADSVSDHLGIFTKTMGSSGDHNLRAKNKLQALEEEFGPKGFDYAGDAPADYPVWQGARKAIVVGASQKVLNKAKQIADVDKIFEYKNSKLKLIIKQIRVYQWVKNILIFLPLLMAHIIDPSHITKAIYAFFAFSFTASFVYVLNDLMDLESDRMHPRKKFRPLASGAFSIKTALVMTPLLLIIGLGISIFLLPWQFTAALLCYFVLTTAYSFILKRIYIMDMIVLASLYTLRLIAGALAVDVPLSPWLLEFSMFIFLSLAVLKRYTELRIMIENNKKKSKGRGYIVEDFDILRSIGPALGYISVLVLVLYVNSDDISRLYKYSKLLWPVSICLLFWITRIWFLAHRGRMTDDPIVFTGKDPVSYVLGIIVVILAIGAKYGFGLL